MLKQFWDEILLAGILIPVGKKILDSAMEKGARKFESRVEKLLGFKEAKKDITDEILYAYAVSQLTELQQNEADAFEARLRAESPQKAEAFVYFIAKIVKNFEREIKKVSGGGGKGNTAPKIEELQKNLDEGLALAKVFLERLLKKNGGGNENEIFEARVNFLQSKSVFSVIPEKKPAPIAELGRKIFNLGKEKAPEISNKGAEVASSVGRMASDVGAKIAEHQKENIRNLKDQAAAFRAWTEKLKK